MDELIDRLAFVRVSDNGIPFLPSAPIQLKCGVQMSELDAGVISCELPVSDGVIFVARFDPRGDLAHQVGFIGDTPIQALRRENGEFGFRHVEPASMLWRVVPFEAFDEATRLGRRERCVERGRFVC